MAVLLGMTLFTANPVLGDVTPEGTTTSQWGPVETLIFPSGSQTPTTPDSAIMDVACATDDLCIAAGFFKNADDEEQAFTAVLTNGVWSTATPVVIDDALQAPDKNAKFQHVSCGSETSCTAVGRFKNSDNGFSLMSQTYSAGTWNDPETISVVDVGQAANSQATATALSCTTATECSVAGYFYNEDGNQDLLVVNMVDGVWQTGERPLFADGLTDNSLEVETTSLACSSAGNCHAGGQFYSADGTYEAFIISSDEGVWGIADRVAYVTDTERTPASANDALTAISCVLDGDCTAVGYFEDNSANSQGFILPLTGNEPTATALPEINGAASSQLSDVSCTANSCVTAGSAGGAAIVMPWSDGVWGTAVPVPIPSDMQSQLSPSSVARTATCVSTSCLVSGSFRNTADSSDTFITTYDGETWSDPERLTIDGNPADADRRTGVSGVACPSIGRCVLGGSYRDDNGDDVSLAVQQLPTVVAYAVVDNSAPLPGGNIVLAYPAGSFAAGESVSVYFADRGVTIGTGTAGQDGSAEITATIPSDADAGPANLAASGSASGHTTLTPIVVSATTADDVELIDYAQPGQYDIGPCLTESDTDCIEQLGYFDASGNLIEAGFQASAGDPGFTCEDGHLFTSSGSYWHAPGLQTAEGGSTLLAGPSLTTPGFNHRCSRSEIRPQDTLVAERVFVSIYSAVDHGNGTFNQASATKPNCPEGGQCGYGLGPGEGLRLQMKLRISGFDAAYAYTTTSDTLVDVELTEGGGAVVTLSGVGLSIPGVSDTTSFNEGSLRTANQADYLANSWGFELKNANDPGFPSACSVHGFPLVSGNHAYGGEPSWDSQSEQLTFNMGAPHLAPDGEQFLGVYEARIPVDYAECLWGIDPTSLVTDLEVAVIDEDGTEREPGEFDASITIVDDMLHIDADGFHFSEPDIVVRSAGGNGFTAIEGARPVNTRDDADTPKQGATKGYGDPLRVNVGALDAIPADAAAVAVNITATGAEEWGFVAAYPCGSEDPTEWPGNSNVNFDAGATVANSAIVPLDDGYMCLLTYGKSDVIVDVSGYFAGGFTPIDGERPVNSRDDADTPKQGATKGYGDPLRVNVGALDAIPADAAAVAVNITATGAEEWGFVAAYPCSSEDPTEWPGNSNVNFDAGATVANSAIVPLDDGYMCLLTYGKSDVIVDVVGYTG